MPPGYRKRRRYSVGARPSKRRRGSRRVSFRRGRRTHRLGRRRRSRTFRRFKRKFRRSRRSRRSNPVKQRHRLEFKITEPRETQVTYGQQHTVPNAGIEMECIYFSTEVYDTAIVNNRDAVNNSLLGGISDVLALADYAFTNTPQNHASGSAPGWTHDNIWGKLFVKGMDTYTLRNQSNETVRLTMYYCRCRKDTLRYNGTNRENLINYLGQGFSENGYNVANADYSNAAVTTDNMNPRQSRLFCRTFKIFNQKRITIPPGESVSRSIFYRWRKHTPADYVLTSDAATAFASRTRRYGHIKGEKFILFKLHGNIAGVAGQTDITKLIAQTTPTVIMKTERRYWHKHFPRPLGSVITFTGHGVSAGAGSIIIDNDEVAGAEIDAS